MNLSPDNFLSNEQAGPGIFFTSDPLQITQAAAIKS